MKVPPKDELQNAWEDLKAIHDKHLKSSGVKIPKASQFSESNKSIWLSILYLYRDREVSKDEISEITRHYNSNAGANQQVRHLKRDGWRIGDKPGVHQLDPYLISKEFERDTGRRRKILKSKDFIDIKNAYDYCCATCGVREGESSPRYGEAIVKLEKGHRDPAGDGDDPSNIIPQCQFCNRAYQNDWVFDEKGRAHSIASVEPVK